MGEQKKTKRLPGRTPEEVERNLINKAMKLAEKKLEDGTASSQLITHFLKLATAQNELDLEKTRSDIRLAEAKEKQLQQYDDLKELLKGAMDAMRSYSPFGGDDHY